MTDDSRFWASVEKIEADFIADCDAQRFVRRMRRKGFDEDVITARLVDVNESASTFSGRPEL